MSPHRRFIVATLLFFVAGCGDSAESGIAARSGSVGEPTGRSSEAFTNIFAVAELGDGRVLLTDSRERVLALVDLQEGRVERLGRRGEGPGEFMSVSTILPREDGSFAVYDANQRRFTLVSADGEITGSEGLEPPPFSGFSAPRGPDGDGWLYIDSRRVGANGLERGAPLFRWDPRTGRADSLLTVMQYAPGQEGSGLVPMARGDAWSFLADGSVARIVADEYHVEWTGGERGAVSGPPIPHTPVPVDDAERRRWVEEILRQPGGGIARSPGSGPESIPDEAVTERLRTFDPQRFPDHRPAFAWGFTPASPRGNLWVKLEIESGSDRTTFDVIDREGQLIHHLRVEGPARVVGFGLDAVYLARRGTMDLEWLERYPYPR